MLVPADAERSHRQMRIPGSKRSSRYGAGLAGYTSRHRRRLCRKIMDVAVHPWRRELRDRVEAAFDFLVTDHKCRKRGRFVAGGLEIFYWNQTTGVRASVQTRAEFIVHLCPLPEGGFPPRADEHYASRRRIEWFDAFDVVKLATGRRPQFSAQQLYGNDPAVIGAYSSTLKGPCQPLLAGNEGQWARLRRQRTARIAHWAGRTQ
jgi:hypothetical protein